MRRSSGEGHIGKRPDGRHYASLDYEGKRRTVYGKSRQEVAQKLDELKRVRDEGRWLSNPQETVADLLDAWLAHKEALGKSYHTVVTYRRMTVILTQHLGTVKLDKLSPDDIQRAHAQMAKSGLKPPTVAYAHRVLTMALSRAVKHRRLTWNPAKALDVAQPEPAVKQALTKEQLLQLFADSEGTRWHALWQVMGTTGMRVSEALALRWDAINWETGTTHLSEQIERRVEGHGVTGGWYAVPLKSKASERDIHFTAETLAALKAHDLIQKREHARAKEWHENGLVFTGLSGQPIRLHTVHHAFKRDLLKQSIVDTSPHALRHTAATLWLDAGYPVHHVAAWLGHASPDVTWRVYAHVLEKRQAEMATATERVLWGDTKTKEQTS